MSESDPELIKELYRDKIRAARNMSPAEKLAASGDLFDEVCARMRSGIRAQFPDADDEAVERILFERLEIARRLEQAQ
jgi:hypothetical protein